MNFPKGALWQALRQTSLDAIRQGTQLSYGSPMTLAEWQRNGAYIVTGISNKKLTLVGASTDIGSALFGDAEYLLDHAIEHQAHIAFEIGAGHWASKAWQLTEIYYWSYFLALSITRMLGDTVWFVDSVIASQLSKLAPAGSSTIGAGTFRISCGTLLSSNDREVNLHKSKGRAHEQIWRSLFASFDRFLKAVPQGARDPIEDRIYVTIQRTASILGMDWPSTLRNLVNYRPGFGYSSVRRGTTLESLRFVETREPYELELLLDRFENNVVSLQRNTPIEEQTKLVARVLIDFTFLLHAIARTLHTEIVERQHIDKRWRGERRRFATERGLVNTGEEWPCQ